MAKKHSESIWTKVEIGSFKFDHDKPFSKLFALELNEVSMVKLGLAFM